MKKLLALFCLLLAPVYAADKIHVEALDDFDTQNPTETFKVKVIEDGQMDETKVIKGDIINCTLEKVTDPTRAKRDAKIFFYLTSYVDKKGTHEINPKLMGKYAKKVLNKEEIKKTPKKDIAKKGVSTVGGFFVKGLSYGVSFVDGVAQNQEGNRLKSGAKQVYDDSFLSLVEYGQEVQIKSGDIFYLIVKKAKEIEEEIEE